jgi:hypothetical protein
LKVIRPYKNIAGSRNTTDLKFWPDPKVFVVIFFRWHNFSGALILHVMQQRDYKFSNNVDVVPA